MSETTCVGCKANMDKVHDDKVIKLRTLECVMQEDLRTRVTEVFEKDPPELVLNLGGNRPLVRVFAQTSYEQGFLICYDTPEVFQNFRMADTEFQAAEILSDILGQYNRINDIPRLAQIMVVRLGGALAYTNKLPFPEIFGEGDQAVMKFFDEDDRMMIVTTDTDRSRYKFKIRWGMIESEGWTNSCTRLAEDLEKYLDDGVVSHCLGNLKLD